MSATLDLAFARAQFPSLASGWAFLDNAGGSQTLRGVSERFAEYVHGSMAASGAPYHASRLGAERLQNAAAKMASLVNAADPHEIVMGSSTTQLLLNLGLSMAYDLRDGDEIIVSRAEHYANVGPWERLEKLGVRLKLWPVDRETWSLRPADLADLITDRTKLVAFTQCSNVLGTLHDVSGAVQVAHARGVPVLVDGVAYAPHRAIDVQALDVDYYVLSTYKVFGPHHAVLYGKLDRLLAHEGINHSFLAADDVPYKMQPGNASGELSHAATAVVDYLQELGKRAGASASASPHARIQTAYEAIAAHEETLLARLVDYVASQPRIEVVGHATADQNTRVSTISLRLDGVPPRAIPERLTEHRVGVRTGDFYAKQLALDYGFAHEGLVRVSFAHYNSLEEVDRLVAGLDSLL